MVYHLDPLQASLEDYIYSSHHIVKSCANVRLNQFCTSQYIPDQQKWRTAQKAGTFTSPWTTGRGSWGVLSNIRSIIWQTPLSSKFWACTCFSSSALVFPSTSWHCWSRLRTRSSDSHSTSSWWTWLWLDSSWSALDSQSQFTLAWWDILLWDVWAAPLKDSWLPSEVNSDNPTNFYSLTSFLKFLFLSRCNRFWGLSVFLHRSSRFVVSCGSGCWEVHRGLQTHGQLQIYCHSCFSRLCIYLDHGMLLCCPTSCWLVQVRNRFPENNYNTS